MKQTNFIALDIERATIHDVAIAADNAAIVMNIQITHPDLPGKRWFYLNSRNSGYVSRYTKTEADRNADCYCVAAHPTRNQHVVAARFHKISKSFARGEMSESDASAQTRQIESLTGWSASMAVGGVR